MKLQFFLYTSYFESSFLTILLLVFFFSPHKNETFTLEHLESVLMYIQIHIHIGIYIKGLCDFF